ncbi:sigma 54-interacting transcriptional regulator [Desulfovibrio sp. OttesenSCG-928-C06]|nr:sigma 54-interacting transcriptional regulator [Desulfovibrio sp. OttesenSCG-928-C06]
MPGNNVAATTGATIESARSDRAVTGSRMTTPQIRYETNELRLLFEVIQALEGATELADHLETTLELMARYTGMMRGTLTLLDSNGQDIAVEAAYGLKSAEKRRAHYKLGEGITGKVIATGKGMLVPKISEEPLFLNRTGARDVQKEEISFICVPILIGGKAIGALSADRLFADPVCLEEDMRLLQVLASLIARAVQTRLDFKAQHSAVVEENRRLQSLVRGKFHVDNMVGSSAVMRSVFEELAQVASSNATVLIRGESGTGKEMIASNLHSNSPRAGRPFIKVNCAALPEGLVESELFGYERGAFTGAVSSRKGRFEMAHGGTLFLDEVGDMTLTTQAKLLRAIQEKEFERVGGNETIRVDVRLIAATNRDLEDMVSRGTFRQDLYYRLTVFPIFLPPLRERRDDIMALVTHFIDKAMSGSGKKIARITPEAIAALMSYEWPGNIRELENIIERAVILCGEDGILGPQHLPLWLQRAGGDAPASTLPSASATSAYPTDSVPGVTLAEAVDALEKRMITECLEASGGNMAKSAQQLGITERIMGLRMKKYGLDYRLFRKRES